MKLIKIGAALALTAGTLSAQGVFEVSPNDGVSESIPLEFSAFVNLGWDDNITPTTNSGDESLYTSFGVGANYVNFTPQNVVDVNLLLGMLYYFDNVDDPNAEDTYYTIRLPFSFTHHVSERLRFETSNYLFYGLEPDYNYGVVNDRTNDEYFFFSTDNSVGYKWTERLGTYTGIQWDTLNYDGDDSRNDRQNLVLYNQFRYVVSQQTIATLDYRYRFTDVTDGRDSDNQKVLLGFEHRFSETSVLIARAGVQYRTLEGANSQTDPTFEIEYRNKVNESFQVSASTAYEINDYGTSLVLGDSFENNQVFRINIAGDYYLSPDLFFTGGVNYINNHYYGGTPPSDTVDTFNMYIGATYQIMHNLSGNINYNYTTSDDETGALNRNYDRNRVQTGLTYTF
ncbi:hypothetical protein [Rubritalea sp.]|uniref:hypothetical protein n=1 Tax=Rubritalea sp. TaxID=2109375 RepID=UPI003EF9A69F